MLILDTSAILAALSTHDPHHSEALAGLRGDRGPFIVAAGILSESTYIIEVRLGHDILDAFLADLHEGAFALDCGTGDLPRIRALVTRYRDLPLGFADASVMACAERTGGRVLTYDLRHFPIVAREKTIRIVGFDEG